MCPDFESQGLPSFLRFGTSFSQFRACDAMFDHDSQLYCGTIPVGLGRRLRRPVVEVTLLSVSQPSLIAQFQTHGTHSCNHCTRAPKNNNVGSRRMFVFEGDPIGAVELQGVRVLPARRWEGVGMSEKRLLVPCALSLSLLAAMMVSALALLAARVYTVLMPEKSERLRRMLSLQGASTSITFVLRRSKPARLRTD